MATWEKFCFGYFKILGTRKMKIIIFSFIYVLILSFTVPPSKKRTYIDNNITCTYETSDGRMDGHYISYYKTGKKKSEGDFENNYRTGKWTVWDSTGKIRVQREYSDPFNFKQLIPKISKEKPIKLLNCSRYTIRKNQDSFIDLFYVNERMVRWETRIWRTLDSNNNPIIFNDNKLFNIINQSVLERNIKIFDPIDDEFSKELSSKPNISSLKIIGFKIKEDCFFDNERLVTESRIIGLCPVAIDKLTRDTVDLYWVYFPQIRKYLARGKIQQSGLPSKIKTFDDLFFYRYFHGQIFKETNVYDSKIKTNKASLEIVKNAERIEISLIEREHDIWVHFTP